VIVAETNSSLVSNILFQTGTTNVMSTTKTYDALNRLTHIRTFNAQLATLNAHSYQYNAANQRTRRTEADNSYWDYTYDALGQVTAGWKKWSDGTPVAGQQYGYAYDDIGNRELSAVSGQWSAYSANNLNQYTQRTVPGYIWELGTAASNATVMVNNQPVTRQGEYFHKLLLVNNASSAIYTQLTTVAVLKNAGSNQLDIVSSTTGKVFVAKSPELFAYDADGNLTNDGRFAYVWDAENRLVNVETAVSAVQAGAPKQKLLLGYDSQSRRVSKVVSNYVSGSWLLASDSRFIYDGWNLLAELNATNGVVRSYTWGLDLSGSEQGAGGIGGLLSVNAGTNGTHFVAFDGNGNVTALVDAGSGNISAQYEYSPFGELIRATGPMSKQTPFRFSTKYQDDEAGLLYYGYRYYQPVTGRWVSRDPIEEIGSESLYAFVLNDAINQIDPFGLFGSHQNQCNTVTAQLFGELDRNSISNYGKDPEYLARGVITEIVVPHPIPSLPGPGTPPGQGTGRIRLPGGITVGYRWIPMNPHVAARVRCRMKNMCKGKCQNPCCDWDKEWQEDYLYGVVVATLRDRTAPEGSPLRWWGAWCDIAPNQLTDGLRRCRASSVTCN